MDASAPFRLRVSELTTISHRHPPKGPERGSGRRACRRPAGTFSREHKRQSALVPHFGRLDRAITNRFILVHAYGGRSVLGVGPRKPVAGRARPGPSVAGHGPRSIRLSNYRAHYAVSRPRTSKPRHACVDSSLRVTGGRRRDDGRARRRVPVRGGGGGVSPRVVYGV